jgi:hypothetical protein
MKLLARPFAVLLIAVGAGIQWGIGAEMVASGVMVLYALQHIEDPK